MARYKHIDTSPRFLAVDLERQLLPGTFEHALCHLIDHEIDLSGFDARYRNDLSGATAYPPAMLLKVVLFAYSRGLSVRAPSSASAANTSPSLRSPGQRAALCPEGNPLGGYHPRRLRLRPWRRDCAHFQPRSLYL